MCSYGISPSIFFSAMFNFWEPQLAQFVNTYADWFTACHVPEAAHSVEDPVPLVLHTGSLLSLAWSLG